MTEAKKGTYLSSDGKTKIAYRVYLPEGNPRAILQICHGMTEHMGRYEDFARAMCEKGIIVCGNDHLGHGESGSPDDWGFFAEEKGDEKVVRDVLSLTELMRGKYRTLPYVLLGHSMGSFIARKYAAEYREHIDGLIISGTSGGGSAEKAAKVLAGVLCKLKGKRSHSKLLTDMVNSNNRKRFLSEGELGWLTRDPAVRERYFSDPACRFTFTVGAYRDMFSMLCEVNEDAWFDAIALDLPVFIMSGSDDSVGGFGAGVTSVYERLKEREICDLTFKLYEGGRHEMLNELNREEVYADMLSFIDSVCEGIIALRTGGSFDNTRS